MTESELFKKSEQIKQDRQKFLIEYLNLHEAKNREFIKEIISFYNIQTLTEFEKYIHLMPDSTARLLFLFEYQKKG